MPRNNTSSELTKTLYSEKISSVEKKLKLLNKKIDKRADILQGQETERTELEQLLSELKMAEQRI
jgi:Asp/Glu/hydantoin racemase